MRYLAILLLLAVTAGCGYHFPGQGNALPGGGKSVYLPLFVNRTLEPQLENLVSNEVSRSLARNGNLIQVEKKEQAEAQLEGIISSFTNSAIAYDKNDDISEYRARMKVDALLHRISDGRLLWQGSVTWSEDYSAADDKARQRDLKREAIEEISRRIADELLSRMLDDF